MFGGLTHEPAVRLARTLVDITPAGLEHVFLADSGSVSVEVAVKMCLQYRRSWGARSRRRLATWRGGYHGDTFHPMSVCDPEGGMHSLWGDVLPRQVFVAVPPPGFDAPTDDAYVAELETRCARHADELAAVIVEPVVQGAGGMRFHDPGYLRVLRRAVTRRARHPADLRRDRHRVRPYRRAVRRRARRGDPGRAVRGQGAHRRLPDPGRDALHAGGRAGHLAPAGGAGARPTFMGNPLACAVANASIGLLRARDWAGQVARVERGPARRPGAAAGRARGGGRAGAGRDRRGAAGPRGGHRARRPRPRSRRGCGCARSGT